MLHWLWCGIQQTVTRNQVQYLPPNCSGGEVWVSKNENTTSTVVEYIYFVMFHLCHYYHITQTHWERLFPCWFSQAGYETSSFCYVFFCRSNLMGTKFTVYDSGLNPMKSTTSLEASNLRQELAAICYVSWSKCTLTPNSTLLYLGRQMLTITYTWLHVQW